MDKNKKPEWMTLSLSVDRETYDRFMEEKSKREKRELRKITASDAIREALLRTGYEV